MTAKDPAEKPTNIAGAAPPPQTNHERAWSRERQKPNKTGGPANSCSEPKRSGCAIAQSSYHSYGSIIAINANEETEQMALQLVGSGPGHYYARPRIGQWASEKMFNFLKELSDAWGRDDLDHPFGLGDVSLQDGSAPKFHKTHVWGSCVDIYIIRQVPLYNSIRDGDGEKIEVLEEHPRLVYTDPGYDLRRTTKLMDLILTLRGRHKMMQVIYNDVRVWPGYRLRQFGSGSAVPAATGYSPVSAFLKDSPETIAATTAAGTELPKGVNWQVLWRQNHEDHIHVGLS
jgi:hypothetical protein